MNGVAIKVDSLNAIQGAIYSVYANRCDLIAHANSRTESAEAPHGHRLPSVGAAVCLVILLANPGIGPLYVSPRSTPSSVRIWPCMARVCVVCGCAPPALLLPRPDRSAPGLLRDWVSPTPLLATASPKSTFDAHFPHRILRTAVRLAESQKSSIGVVSPASAGIGLVKLLSTAGVNHAILGNGVPRHRLPAPPTSAIAYLGRHCFGESRSHRHLGAYLHLLQLWRGLCTESAAAGLRSCNFGVNLPFGLVL